MYTISINGSPKSIIKNIKYNLNGQQYIETGRSAHFQDVNIGVPVFRKPPWEGRTKGTAALPPET